MIDKEVVLLNDNDRIAAVKDIQKYLAEKIYYSSSPVGPDFIASQEWVKNYQRNNGYGTGVESRAKLWIDKGR
jgi:hypothetical protein